MFCGNPRNLMYCDLLTVSGAVCSDFSWGGQSPGRCDSSHNLVVTQLSRLRSRPPVARIKTSTPHLNYTLLTTRIRIRLASLHFRCGIVTLHLRWHLCAVRSHDWPSLSYVSTAKVSQLFLQFRARGNEQQFRDPARPLAFGGFQKFGMVERSQASIYLSRR
jgi:hypothetical protein